VHVAVRTWQDDCSAKDRLKSMIFYLLLCAISILAGQGILCLTGIHIERRISLYLAPVITLIFWAIMLGVGVSFGFPVKSLSMIGWPLTIVMVCIGAIRQDYYFIRTEWPLLLVVVFLPVSVMIVYFWYGILTYPGSPHPDGWSYIAYGQYLWEYPRGVEGGLPPLYQYATHLNQVRFIASALLGFLSPFIRAAGDTQAPSGSFLAWTIFVLSSTCMSFAVIKRLSTTLLLLYLSMSIFSSWLVNLLWANNYDNALALSFLPAFAGVLSIADAGNRRWCVILALLATGILYCYPELATVVLGGAFLFLLQRISLNSKSIKEWSIVIIVVASSVAILLIPFGNDMMWFVGNQASVLTLKSGARPGEGFPPELLIPEYRLMAFWGFGREGFAGKILTRGPWYYIQGVLAIYLSMLLGLGLLVLCKRKEWGLSINIVLLLIGSTAMIIFFSYPYGAYKFILLNWWGISFAIVVGIEFLIGELRTKKYMLILWSCFTGTLFAIFLFINGLNIISFGKVFEQKSMTSFREVEKIKNIVGGSSIIIAVDNDIANMWAVYYLRDFPIYLAEFRSYMAQSHVMPGMLKSQQIDLSNVRYILTDSKGLNSFPLPTLVWSRGAYDLWSLSSENWIFISSIQNLKRIEERDGEQIFWLGHDDAEIRLVSSGDGQAVISADFMRGPGWSETLDSNVVVSTDQRYSSIIGISEDGPQMLSIPIVAGRNRIILRPLQQSLAAVLPYTEPEPLLLGVRGMKVNLQRYDR
jgi:hypothetical protein